MKKIVTLALIMMCTSNAYSMEDEKNNLCLGLSGHYGVWEVDPNAKENAIPYVLISQLIDESVPGNTFFALFLMLVQAISR